MRGDPCQFGLDPHHIIPRSQGGDDVADNVITLCRKHHDMAEEHKIKSVDLEAILIEIYGESDAEKESSV